MLKTITKADFQAYFENMFGDNCKRVDFRYNSKAHQEAEAACEFKPEGVTVQHASIAMFRKSMGLYSDLAKVRYASSEQKL